MMKSFKFVLLVSLFFMGCVSNSDNNIPDVSNIKIDFDIHRFDHELKSLDSLKMLDQIQALKAKYPAFANLYFNSIYPIDLQDAELLSNTLKGEFFNYLLDTTSTVFGEMADIKKDLHEAYQFLKYYFPNSDIPDVYCLVSEFGYQRFIFSDENEKDALGIGLDLFMGSDFPYKEIDPSNPAFSDYLTRSFNKEHLVKKSIETILEDKLGPAPGNRMLDIMIHNGKKLYFLDKILPSTPDSIILEYTTEQTDWVSENELEMWAFFFREDLFYESNTMKIGKYLNPSPNSPKMPDNAPGMTGNYLGWKIVEAYMNRFPQTSINDLIIEKDAQKILDQSKFKPRK